MTIDNGSTVRSPESRIAYEPNSTGSVTVTGIGSLWENEGTIGVGSKGVGSLAVSNEATVSSTGSIHIGSTASEQISSVTVTGQNSKLVTEGAILLYHNQNLDILDGGYVSSRKGLIGYDAGYISKVKVDGIDSMWDVGTGELSLGVGDSGYADIIISNGGNVKAGETFIAKHSGSTATVTVTGTNSLLQTEDLHVSRWGDVNMVISDGGKVSSVTSYIAYYSIGRSYVSVTGADSLWENSGDLYVGYIGDSNMVISNGGQVTNKNGYISYYHDKNTVIVIGANSLWKNYSNLYIGGQATKAGGTGILIISDDGVVEADNVTIWDKGYLGGDSLLRANSVINKGTISPGNSIGTLTIDGDLAIETRSTLEIEIDNNGNSDKVDVTGITTISGGEVEPNPTETITGSQEYIIMESTGGITGVFDSIDRTMLNNVFFDSELGYETDSVILNISAVPFNDPTIVLNSNQSNIGTTLQQIADGGGNSVTTELQQLTNLAGIRKAYDQLSGQSRTSLPLVTNIGNSQFTGTITDRLGSIRSSLFSGISGGSLLAMAEPSNNESMYDTQISPNTFALGNGTSYFANQRWGIWSKGYGVFGDREKAGSSPGYQYNVYGTGFGFDYKFTDSLLLGITGGYSEADVDYFASRDSSDISSTSIGIYGSWDSQDGYYDSILTYSPAEYETKRYISLTNETLSGEFDGYEISGYFEAGRYWNYRHDCLIQPLAAFQFSYLDIDSYTESGGASALSYNDQSHKSYKGSLGVKLIRQLGDDLTEQSSTVELRGRWVHEFGDTKSNIKAHFADHPSALFTISDSGIERDSAVLGIGYKKIVKQNTKLFIDYDTSFNQEETSHIISAGLEYRW